MIVMGEANNGVDAISIINKFKPDLVFMDIQMPGMTGFEVLGHLDELPDIVFSTAYDQYALKAFEVHAVDYLLKPYTRERFNTALEKVKSRTTAEHIAPLAEEQLSRKEMYPTRIIVQKMDRYVTLDTATILYLEAYGDYSRIFSANDIFLGNHGLGDMENKLDPVNFMRVHRSHIVRVDQISEISKIGKGFVLTLSNAVKVRVSRTYADRIRQMMV